MVSFGSRIELGRSTAVSSGRVHNHRTPPTIHLRNSVVTAQKLLHIGRISRPRVYGPSAVEDQCNSRHTPAWGVADFRLCP